MNMQSIKILSLIVLISATLNAQSLSGIKICIDPGHGGHDAANDRHVMPPDFWESESNFGKALHVREILQSLGATVILTRSGNSDADDISLSARDAIANANNVDYFHSIHSNATGTANRVNFPLILFRGYDNAPVFPASKTYANIVWQKIYECRSGTWSTSNLYVRGDYDFYGWTDNNGNPIGLGVLRYLNMPGTLSEGSFHDYIPEAWRLKNTYYQRHEAWAITRAFLDHFNKGKLTTGTIAGILRDQNETVPSSYQPLSGTNDNKKPINFVKVTLTPGNIVYNGDDQNNGYYFFDNVAPGQYKLYFEAEDYAKDSATVTVVNHKSVFANKMMVLQPNLNAPNVVASSPADQNGDVRLSSKIKIDFDIRMNTSSVESAFSITPALSGTFVWSNNSKTVEFTPSALLQAGVNYQVTVSTAAKTYFNISLAQPYSFNFTTRSKLNFVKHYPLNNSDNVSPSVKVSLRFDSAIKSSTLPGNILFLNKDNKNVDLTVDQNSYSKGRIEFEPKSPLNPGEQYKVVVKSGVGDTENLKLGSDYEILFTVDPKQYQDGTIKDDFESGFSWGSPFVNSIGVDSTNTSFAQTTAKKYGGSSAGVLNYSFNSTNGFCRVEKTSPVLLGSNAETNFGVWVFGDFSNNLLQFVFRDAFNDTFVKTIDTLNWTGWKLKSVKLGEVTSSTLSFSGFSIEQTGNSDNSGIVYFDNAQTDFTTDAKEDRINLPSSFLLEQNYPNPFNPNTTIAFEIPKAGNVVIKLYNIIGKEVMTLVNEFKQPGKYKAVFDADKSRLSSGVYFYKMSSGEFSQTKKMVLLK